MPKTNIKPKLKENLEQLKEIGLKVFPQNRGEYIFLILILLFYLPYSLYLALNTTIVTGDELKMADFYFSFDNPVFFHIGSKVPESHPLLLYFAKPLIWFGRLLVYIAGIEAKIIFFTLLSSSFISLSAIYIYRYLKEIIGISGYTLIVICLFYVSMFTNMILCFTTESYTVSAFLLSFMVYIYASYNKKGEKLRFSSHALFMFSVGGVTSTNSIKAALSIIFEDITNKIQWKKAILMLFLFSLTILCRPGLLFSAFNRYEKFSTLDFPGSKLEKIFSGLLGSPILAPGMTWDAEIQCIFTSYYTSWLQYAFSFLILGIVFLSIYLNRKNKYVLMLACFLICDLLLHVVAEFGLDEGFIYGAHWVFTIPLFMGWLFINSTKKWRKYLSSIFTIIFICTFINNLYRLEEFISLTLIHFGK